MYTELKEKSFEANMLLPKFHLIDLTFGNVSVIDREKGVWAIKPSGVGYDILKPSDIVILDMDGKKVEGTLNPSSDSPTHHVLYQSFKDIGAVVHTHSRNATSFAQACCEIPCYGTTHADYFHGGVPLTRLMTPQEIAEAYEYNTGMVIVERFSNIPVSSYPGVLVANHGPFSWGDSGTKAVENAFAMEILAEMALKTESLNPQIKPISKSLLDKHFLRKHGPNRYYGQK